MTATHATAYAVAAAYRELPAAGQLLTRTEAGRRAAKLLDVTVGTTRVRIAAAISAGDLIEIPLAADGSITLPGVEFGATLYTRTGPAEGIVEAVLDIDARGTRAPRRPLLITPQDCQRLAQHLAAVAAESAAADAVSVERIREALTVAGLRSADGGDGFEVTWARDGVPMVLFLRGSQLRPPRNATPELAQEWERHLTAYRVALDIAGFEVERRGYTVRVLGTKEAEGPEALAEFRAHAAEKGLADPAPAVIAPTITVARWFRIANGMDEDAIAPAAPVVEPVAEPTADPAELVRISGAWCITREQADANRERAAEQRAAFEAESAQRREAERYYYGPEREAAQRAAVEAARALLAAVGVPDLDVTPTANTGVRLRKADRPGVWVMVRQIRGILSARPDAQRQPFDAREWDHNFATWAAVLRRAGWETTEPSELSFYAAPPAGSELGAEEVAGAVLVEDQEPAAAAPVLPVTEGTGSTSAAPGGERVLDGRDLVGSLFADGLPFERTAPAAVEQLRRAGEVLAAQRDGAQDSAEADGTAAVEAAAAALSAATRTATPDLWRRVAVWLVNRDVERRTGTPGNVMPDEDGRGLAETVPGLAELVDRAARLLAVWLTARSLPHLKAADEAAREVSEALHSATRAGRMPNCRAKTGT